MSCILQFIDSPKFVASLLSKLFNNLSEQIQKLNVNSDMVIKNVKHVELNISIATVFLNIKSLKMV